MKNLPQWLKDCSRLLVSRLQRSNGRSLLAGLSAFFGALALLLVSVGVYGLFETSLCSVVLSMTRTVRRQSRQDMRLYGGSSRISP
jgi:hypothetical protein